MDIEQEIRDAGADVAPRITPADIEANILSEHCFTAADGVHGCAGFSVGNDWLEDAPEQLELLTICVLILRNGFTVTGESACASPENFKPEIGKRIARENAVAKVWPLLGYELRTRLASRPAPVKKTAALLNAAPPDFRDRVRFEAEVLDQRIARLSAFVVTELFDSLPAIERESMTEQLKAMRAYSKHLHDRISRF